MNLCASSAYSSNTFLRALKPCANTIAAIDSNIRRSFPSTLILLAFLGHTLLDLLNTPYQLLRQALTARRTFFDDLRAHPLVGFDTWDQLFHFLIRRLELTPPPTETVPSLSPSHAALFPISRSHMGMLRASIFDQAREAIRIIF